MLNRFGYVVMDTVLSGEAALRRISNQCPDLVLMDIKLKGSMDGVETAAEIDSRFGVPVIYITACIDKQTKRRIQATRHFGYLVKPLNEDELLSIIESATH